MLDMPASKTVPRVARRAEAGRVAAWLWGVAALVLVMVLLGGATRLTESGLSITEWKPITGVVPPLTHAAWLDAFAKYKQIPQYESLFPTMTLGHFQAIFLMEWTHRFIARFVGVVLLVPLIVFAIRGSLSRRLSWQVLGCCGLYGLLAIAGWWMVKSGLAGRVEVAQERLATHLLLAAFLFASLTWLAASQRRAVTAVGRTPVGIERFGPAAVMLRPLATAVVVLVFVQIGFGALVAGLRAGRAYNTWPLMDGRFLLPADVLGAMHPLWRNLVDNVAEVQFQHRMTAYLLLVVVLVQAIAAARLAPGTAAMRRSAVLLALVVTQAAIGIVTLVLVVPIWAGLLHQVFAMVVLGMAVVHRQRFATGATVTAQRDSPREIFA